MGAGRPAGRDLARRDVREERERAMRFWRAWRLGGVGRGGGLSGIGPVFAAAIGYRDREEQAVGVGSGCEDVVV